MDKKISKDAVKVINQEYKEDLGVHRILIEPNQHSKLRKNFLSRKLLYPNSIKIKNWCILAPLSGLRWICLCLIMRLGRPITQCLPLPPWHSSLETSPPLTEKLLFRQNAKTPKKETCMIQLTIQCSRLWSNFRHCPDCRQRMRIFQRGCVHYSKVTVIGAIIIFVMVMASTRYTMSQEIKTGKNPLNQQNQSNQNQVNQMLLRMHRKLMEFAKKSDSEKITQNDSHASSYFTTIWRTTNEELTLAQHVIKWYFVIAILKFTLEISLYIVQIIVLLTPFLKCALGCAINSFLEYGQAKLRRIKNLVQKRITYRQNYITIKL